MKNKSKRPELVTSIKTSGADGTTLIICLLICVMTLVVVNNS